MNVEEITAKAMGFRRQISRRPTMLWISVGCLLLAVCMLIVSGLLTDSAGRKLSGSVASKELFEGRNFTFEPFTLMDANHLCERQARAKRGASLLRYTMNPLSTRYEADKNRYIIVLDADIGTVESWSEISLFCDIDPVAHRVSYYKEIYDDDSSLLSTVKGLFGNMF